MFGILSSVSAQIALAAVLLLVADRAASPAYLVHTEGAIVVTGASSGIGRATAIDLAARGFIVYAGVRKQQDAEDLRGYKLNGLRPVILDVTKADDIQKLAEMIEREAASDKKTPLVALINNAGVSVRMPFEAMPERMLRQLYDVNVFGLTRITQALLPSLRRAQGRIVNVGSVAGVIAQSTSSSYSGTKFAVRAITDSLRREMAPFGVAVSLVAPGYVRTKISEKNNDAKTLGALMTPEHRRLYADWLSSFTARRKRAFELAADVDVTTDAIAHAVTAQRPQTVYTVGNAGRLPAWFVSRLMQALPDRIADFLMARQDQIAGINVPEEDK